MAKHGTRYPEEFKRQIVDLYHAGTPVTKLANEYGLVEQTIYKWIKNYSPIVEQEDGSTVSTSKDSIVLNDTYEETE